MPSDYHKLLHAMCHYMHETVGCHFRVRCRPTLLSIGAGRKLQPYDDPCGSPGHVASPLQKTLLLCEQSKENETLSFYFITFLLVQVLL